MLSATRPITLYPAIPCGVLLPHKALALYSVLRLMTHNSGETCATLADLGAWIGQRGGGRITAYLTALRDAGLIEIRRGRRVMHYKVKV